jgi:UDP-glucose 4-epimerase
MNNTNRVLVTGGAGFIGSHVTDELISMGLDVVVLDDLSGGVKENINSQATFIEGSINDVELVNALFKVFKFSHVYHLAAYAAEGLSHFIKHFNYSNNLIGSANLINASVNYDVKCFVFTSSIAVYGAGQLPMREDTVPQPEDSYGIAKYAVELELKASHKMFGLNYVIHRPHNVFGERQNIGDKYRNVVGIFMNNIMKGESIKVFGDGEQTRAFSYIDSVSQAIAKSAFIETAYGQVFNVGADSAISVNELSEMVFTAMGRRVDKEHLPARNEVINAYSDHSKAKEILGYEDGIGLSGGIERMANWAKTHGARTTKAFTGIEIEKNLPASWKTNQSN